MSSIFNFIIHPMELGLVWLTTTLGGAGISIILFTIAIRLILSPLQIVQLRNAKAMQRLQPLMQELRQKHGKDREAMSKATMELYKEHNVNPAMGCAPMLLQFPILIGLFYALSHLGQTPTGYPHHINWAKITCNGHHVGGLTSWIQQCYSISGVSNPHHVFDLFHATFLWLSNGLGQPDPLYILPLLAGATQWVQSRMMLTRSTDPQQQTMNFMMNFMPLMIIFFATRYPSGLSLYWVTSTLIGIAIQYRITGLGLLTDVWPFNQTAPAAAGRSGGKPSTPTKAASNGGSGKAGATPVKNATGKPKLAIVPTDGEDTEGMVRDGNAESPENAENGQNGAGTVNRPRKKANRAKGGRSGGRRG